MARLPGISGSWGKTSSANTPINVCTDESISSTERRAERRFSFAHNTPVASTRANASVAVAIPRRSPINAPAVRLSFLSIALTALFMILGTGVASAGTENGVCMVDRYNATKPANNAALNCSSNDVQLAQYELISGPSSCIPGEDITVILKGEFVATSAERWDVGIFVAQDGGTPNDLGGACYSDFLDPVSADNNDLDLINGIGPFYNGEIDEDPSDTCGDIQQGQNAFFTTDEITIKCQDSDNNNVADVESCTVWANSRSAGTDNKPSCNDEGDVTAETTAKCTCDAVEIGGLTVPFTGTIAVNKVVDPASDPGQFNLLIDGGAEADVVVGHNGTTGPVIVSAGTNVAPNATHTVSEGAVVGTDLSRYDTTISCADEDGDTAGGDGVGPFNVVVEPDDAWVCTVTNSLRQGTVVVKKLVVNDNGGTASASDFEFAIDGGTAQSFDETGGGSTDPLTGENSFVLDAGPYTITESALSGYTGSSSGCSPATVVAGETTICEFTNTAQPGTLTLVKTVDNLGETGDGYLDASHFPLTIGGSPATSNVSQLVDAGDIAIAETPDADYGVGRWECDNGADGVVGAPASTVTVGNGETVACSITNTLIAAPSLMIDKEGTWTDDNGDAVVDPTDGDLLAQAGEIVDYTFDVTNDGNVTLDNVTVTDPLPGLSAISCVPAQGSTLAPGATMACTASYTLTQADVDAGKVDNIADVDGDDPGGNNVNDDDPNTETLPQNPSIDIDKEGTWTDDNGDAVVDPTDGDLLAQAGEIVDYTFDVTNDGNVTLDNVTVTDPLPGLSAISCVPAQGSTLAPGATMACTASYTLTQADVDAGKVDNIADVDGDDPGGNNVNDDDPNTETLPQNPSIDIDKEGTWTDDNGDAVVDPTDGDLLAQAGEIVDYTFDVTNDGNVTLDNVTVTDPLPGLSAISCVPAQGSTLAPGATMACTASYTLTQADVDAGKVDNIADVDGDDPGGNNVNDDDPNTETLPQNPSIDIDKEGTWTDDNGDAVVDPTDGDLLAQAGEIVDYTFDVTNDGNVTLDNVTVTDPLPGLSAISCVPAQGSTLAPGATMACTASYTLTQADVDAGKVDNIADVDGDDPGGNNVNDDDPNTETLPQNPSIDIDKEGTWTDDNGDAVVDPTDGDLLAQAGEIVDYTFDVTNDGNVTLDNVTVTDPLPGLSAISCVPAQGSTLAPGATMACTASYTLTQADVDAGKVDNIADVDGDDPGGNNVNDDDPNTETLPQNPSIDIDKEGTWTDDNGDAVVDPTDGDLLAQAGEIVDYTFDVTNDGNVTLDNVTVTDPLPGLSAISCVPAQGSTLAPGATMACTASYTLTQADVDAGKVDNIADVDGDDPGGNNVNDDDPNTETLPQNPSVDIDKEGTWTDDDGDAVVDAGTIGDRVGAGRGDCLLTRSM